MKKPWRYERRNMFLPFPRNFAITMIISTVSNLDNFPRALRISDNWLRPSYTLLISHRTPVTAWSCLVHIMPKCISDPPWWGNHKSTVVGGILLWEPAKAYINQFLSNEIPINLFNGSYEGRTLLKGTSLINPTFDWLIHPPFSWWHPNRSVLHFLYQNPCIKEKGKNEHNPLDWTGIYPWRGSYPAQST